MPRLAYRDILKRTKLLQDSSSTCNLCGHYCGVDRNQEEVGVCNSGPGMRIAASNCISAKKLFWSDSDY